MSGFKKNYTRWRTPTDGQTWRLYDQLGPEGRVGENFKKWHRANLIEKMFCVETIFALKEWIFYNCMDWFGSQTDPVPPT